MPEADKQLVMHIELPILGGHVLMGTDMPTAMPTVVHGNGLQLNLAPDSRADTDRLFSSLAAGGTVDMPLQVMVWGDYFGSLTDRFGNHRMFNCTSQT